MILLHIIASLVLVALGFGLGRIKNKKSAEDKVAEAWSEFKAEVETVKAEAKKL